jgi:hypothetical protein
MRRNELVVAPKLESFSTHIGDSLRDPEASRITISRSASCNDLAEFAFYSGETLHS